MYGIDIIGTIHENGDLSFNPDSNIRVFNNVIFEYGGVEYEEADTMLSFKELFYSDRRREKIVSSLDSLKLTNYNKVIQDGTYYLNYSYGIDINLAIIIRNNVFDYYVYGRHFFSGICTKEEGITYLKKDNFSSELIINNDTSFYCTKLPYLMPFTLDRCLFKKETNLIKK
jgi:hypothetical protein